MKIAYQDPIHTPPLTSASGTSDTSDTPVISFSQVQRRLNDINNNNNPFQPNTRQTVSSPSDAVQQPSTPGAEAKQRIEKELEKTEEKIAVLARLIKATYSDESERDRLTKFNNEYNENLVKELKEELAKLNESNEKLPKSAEGDAFPSR
ncbi:hypothetical protein [Erwinia pyrifoliae]|uniref:Uncharacterized protein n=1 Tax=Erwinia pyrifoliae TaxID=79967 RepID=A0ABY5X821_ERWPY|nr:hypothetical protein [Erwinia pyrifoliae]AUX71243.1 hypothetical protein CPI84_01140 [Erwinia pyrifoliae]MCA8875039.1 hypothetical protein [Erwinia pyrifoliae]MCT2385640.1 hypothetical protein [Erwinia pyrifoliae]MCU8588785.1 hypothetical protein [Erwinia pyrifoliae]UWS29144.1 hypothetical protein NYP81_14675 [Erwinia pyrifoliae]